MIFRRVVSMFGWLSNGRALMIEQERQISGIRKDMKIISMDRMDDEHPGTQKVKGYYVHVARKYSLWGNMIGVGIRHSGSADERFVGMSELRALGVGYDLVMEEKKDNP